MSDRFTTYTIIINKPDVTESLYVPGLLQLTDKKEQAFTFSEFFALKTFMTIEKLSQLTQNLFELTHPHHVLSQ